MRAKVYPQVKDVIRRRTDGRPAAAEPFEAFSGELEKLGLSPFLLWWQQTAGELRRHAPETSPVSCCVLSAALAEGALTFIVRHARKLGVAVFQSPTFEGEPRTWKIEALVASASSGRDDAVLDPATRQRADALIRSRQRIHAGRMLSEHPAGPPDLRPEEARDAILTAELVVRRVVDWLARHPAMKT